MASHIYKRLNLTQLLTQIQLFKLMGSRREKQKEPQKLKAYKVVSPKNIFVKKKFNCNLNIKTKIVRD